MKTFKEKSISLCLVLMTGLALASCSDKSSGSILPPPTPTPSGHLVINSKKKVTEVPSAHQMVVNVSSDADFKFAVKDGGDWLTSAQKNHAKGDSVKITFDLKENKSGADRSAALLFATADSKNFTDTVYVTQKSPNHLVINSKKKVTETMGAHKMVVNVSSNVDFKFAVKDGADWITSAEKTHAKGDKIDITFDLKANQSGSDRSAALLFATADSKDFTDTVHVTQTGIITVKTPGTLALEIKNQGLDAMKLTTITVAGALNGSDVLTLREMAGYGQTKKTDGQLTDLNLLNISFVKDATVYFVDPQTSKSYNITGDKDALPDFMFSLCSLKSVTISPANTIKVIGNYAFNSNPLTKITIPEGVTDIGSRAFSYTHLASVVLPKGLKNIHSYAFFLCSSLRTVNIPDKVELIDDFGFDGCSFTDIKLPKNLKTLGHAVFSDCKVLKAITIPEGITSIPDDAFDKCSNLAQVVLPTNLTKIGKDAFLACTELKTITIPEHVNKIGDGAFGLCLALTDINIPTSVKSIGAKAFQGCGKTLKNIKIDVVNPTSIILSNGTFDPAKDSSTNLYVPKLTLDHYQANPSFLVFFDKNKMFEQK